MLRLRSFKTENNAIAIILIGAIIGMALLICGIVAIIIIANMVISNILPIAIAFAIIVAIPIFAKGWFQQKTGTPYQDQRVVN